MSLHPPKLNFTTPKVIGLLSSKFKFRLSISSNECVQEEELLLQKLRLQSRNELDYTHDFLQNRIGWLLKHAVEYPQLNQE